MIIDFSHFIYCSIEELLSMLNAPEAIQHTRCVLVRIIRLLKRDGGLGEDVQDKVCVCVCQVLKYQKPLLQKSLCICINMHGIKAVRNVQISLCCVSVLADCAYFPIFSVEYVDFLVAELQHLCSQSRKFSSGHLLFPSILDTLSTLESVMWRII